MAHLVLGEHRVRSGKYRSAARRPEFQVRTRGRHRAVRDGPQSAGRAVSAREYGRNARHRLRRAGIHTQDSGVGIQRANHGRMELPGKIEIIAETSPTGEEPGVLPAGHGLPDGTKLSFVEPGSLRRRQSRLRICSHPRRSHPWLTGVSGSTPERLRSHVFAPFSVHLPATAFCANASQASVHSPMA